MNDCQHKKWLLDTRNVGTCSECGEIRQFPYDEGDKVVTIKEGSRVITDAGKRMLKRTSPRSDGWKKHQYYEANKGEIIADLANLGMTATCKKWEIPSSTMVGLERRWGKAECQKEPPREEPQGNPGNLPAFPPFSDLWSAEVQVKWLDVYERLLQRA